ncbi:uncharacterized protein LOC130548289 isoform X1 [Triplophysa rosa]|uniref:SLAM family member 6-like n=2 Tax=Triplophysa rosa TaxID=992332 RepID=A0A9W7T7K2_TRIRA|nr:uncharacterized protein LOC130548289 isoform X1 [Triplophysa rosa]KAI7791062.1 putative SLAM family member 6-like [Triplophysa rosa]
MEGDSVTLHTHLTHIQTQDHILWLFVPRGDLIAEIYKQANLSLIYDVGRFRHRLKLDTQTGSLTITNISITNSGLYKLQIRNNTKISDMRFNVTVYARLPVPVIIRDSSQCSSSSERSSVSKCVLLCSVMNVSRVSLSWYKGKSLLSSISVSDLNIRLSLPLEVEYQDTNTYRCVINNHITNHTQHLNINQLCRTHSESKPACIVLALILFVLVLICGICFYWKTRRSRAPVEQDNSDCTKEQKNSIIC